MISKCHKTRCIYQRVKDLIESGMIKDQRSVPLWFESYQRFKPLIVTRVAEGDDAKGHYVSVRNVLYQEDELRLKFYSVFPDIQVSAINGYEQNTFIDFLRSYNAHKADSKSDEESFKFALRDNNIKVKKDKNEQSSEKN
ncbi:MAG: Structural constituent of ribosome [Marteilia pararefringens]